MLAVVLCCVVLCCVVLCCSVVRRVTLLLLLLLLLLLYVCRCHSFDGHKSHKLSKYLSFTINDKPNQRQTKQHKLLKIFRELFLNVFKWPFDISESHYYQCGAGEVYHIIYYTILCFLYYARLHHPAVIMILASASVENRLFICDSQDYFSLSQQKHQQIYLLRT